MIWTYRVLRDEQGRYSIRELYYERDGTLIEYSSVPAVALDGSLEELMRLIQWFQEAFDLPVLSTTELDQQLAAQPTRRVATGQQNIPLRQVLAGLEAEAEPVQA
jgi:hypothetical protein